jgi:mannose-1-phosphate guanylyltransferase/phosphomannomutase
MKALVLCGGLGTRVKNIAKGLPKNLLKIDTKSILEYQLECFEKCNFNEVYLIAGYGIESLQQFASNYKGRLQLRIIKDKEQLGTGHALKVSQEYIDDETFLVMGDLLIDFDFNRMLKTHYNKNHFLICHTHPTNHIFDSDSVTIDNQNYIKEIVLKNSSNEHKRNLALSGIFLLSSKLSKWIKDNAKGDLTKDILIKLLDQNFKLESYKSADFVKDLGTEARLANATKLINSGKYGGHHFKRPAIFLDRDGTINKLNGHVKSESELELNMYAGKGIKELNRMGFFVFVVTNQSVMARGDIERFELDRIHLHMELLLLKDEAFVDEIKFCPHHPDKGYQGENVDLKVNCACRKPNIGLVDQLKNQYNISFFDSWVVGDTWRDEILAKNLKINYARISEFRSDSEFLEFSNILEFANYLKEK